MRKPMIRRWDRDSCQRDFAAKPTKAFWDRQSDCDMKKRYPKKWALDHGWLIPGQVYTYNLVKGHEHHELRPGDQVKLLHTLGDGTDGRYHVEVETLDLLSTHKIHVMCLLLDRECK